MGTTLFPLLLMLLLAPTHFAAAELTCDFEGGMCDWELSGAEGNDTFAWTRTTSANNDEQELFGPDTDWEGSKEGRLSYIYPTKEALVSS